MPKLIVLVCEGAAPPLLERWIGDGSLPGFAALRSGGTWGEFESLPVPYELPTLVSAFSGAPPGHHGTFSLWRIHGEEFDEVPRVTESADVAVPFLWETAPPSLTIAVVNIAGTHPPRERRGYLITYPLYPTIHGCHPERLLRELVKSGISYTHDVSALHRGEPRDEFFATVEGVERGRIGACRNLLARGVDLAVFNLTVIDRLSHFFWNEVEPDSGVDDPDTVLHRAYRQVDAFVGELLDGLAADDHLLVFSEIGFGPLTHYVSLNDALVRAGLQRPADPAHSLAAEAVQGSHGINLNLRRRHAGGLIAEADEPRVREEVRQALLAAVNPATGEPLLAAVHDGPALYPGPHAERAPDLVVEPHDERFQPLGDPRWAARVHRHLQTGWHRRTSFWAGVGPAFRAAEGGRRAQPTDVAQTVVELLDLPPLPTPPLPTPSRSLAAPRERLAR